MLPNTYTPGTRIGRDGRDRTLAIKNQSKLNNKKIIYFSTFRDGDKSPGATKTKRLKTS